MANQLLMSVFLCLVILAITALDMFLAGLWKDWVAWIKRTWRYYTHG